jgi:hypothetical protein
MRLRLLLLITLAVGLLLTTLREFTSAQIGVVDSPRVSGTLDFQFAQHELTLRPRVQGQRLRVVMEYVPQGRQELDNRSGFFIFDRAGLTAFREGAIPGTVAVAAGDRLPGEGRRLQAILQRATEDAYYVVVYNDSPIPMNYILNAENGVFVDPTGVQVIDVFNPPPSQGGQAPLIVLPAPAPTPAPTALPPRRVKSVFGVLENRYDSNYYELVVLDTGRPVYFEMTYEPPEQFRQTGGFEFNVFTEHQFRVMTQNFILPWRAEDMTEGHLTIMPDDGRYIWRAEIVEPLDRYHVVVSQWRYALKWLGYRLTVENAAFLVPREPEPTPTPSPRPAVAQPAGAPYVVVTVIRRPTPVVLETPTPDPFALPTPTPDPFSPLPTPTPFGALPADQPVQVASEERGIDAQDAVVSNPTPQDDGISAASILGDSSQPVQPIQNHMLYLPAVQRE